MHPIVFSCQRTIPKSGIEIASEIANMDRWAEFNGYGPLPGIERAEYEIRTESMIGSRVRVRNQDGSTHVEEFYEWDPGRKISMKMHNFSPPLSGLATHFIEEWTFVPQGNATHATRTFQLFPKSGFTRPLLWIISLLFRRAIERQLLGMAT
jgi:hypothetical protein